MPRHKKRRILCVSHSSQNLQRMLQALPQHDYVGLAASTPEEAVAFCMQDSVAAVVMDSEFPTEYGCSAAQTFKSVNPRLPILLLEGGHNGDVPAGVDGVAASISLLVGKLRWLLNRSS